MSQLLFLGHATFLSILLPRTFVKIKAAAASPDAIREVQIERRASPGWCITQNGSSHIADPSRGMTHEN